MLVVLCVALVVAAVRDNLCLPSKAGLHDRSAIYSKLAALTNSTRSVLYIPSRPCDAFDYTTHGLGGKKDCTRPWSISMFNGRLKKTKQQQKRYSTISFKKKNKIFS